MARRKLFLWVCLGVAGIVFATFLIAMRKDDSLAHSIKEWHATDKELPFRFELWKGDVLTLAEKVPETVFVKIKALENKPFEEREGFLRELSAILSSEELSKFQHLIVHEAARYKETYPVVLASRDGAGGWYWSISFPTTIQDVHVHIDPRYAKGSYAFGTDYRGTSSGNRVDLQFSKSGVYVVKVVFANAAMQDDIRLVVAGGKMVSQMGSVIEERDPP